MSLIVTIAAPFRHTRKDRLKKNEIVYYLAFDRDWMSVEKANIVLKRAMDEGLIAYDGEMLAPKFDITTVDIPIGFKPSSAVYEEHDPVSSLIDRIVRETGKKETELVSEMNLMTSRDFDNLLMPEAAVLILAKRYNVRFLDLLPDLKEHLLKK